MKQFDDKGGYLDNRRYNGGQNKKIKEDVEDQIVEEYKHQPGSTSTAIVVKLSESGITVTDRSVRRARSSLGFCPIKPTPLPTLSESNRKARLKYCKEHKDDKFSNVCFTDESIFQLQANKQVIWYCITSKYWNLEIWKIDKGRLEILETRENFSR